MKIKMLQGLAGANFSLAPGDTPDHFTEKDAQRLIDAGLAEAFNEGQAETVSLELKLENTKLLEELEDLRDLSQQLKDREADLANLHVEYQAVKERAEAAESFVAENQAVVDQLKAKISDLEAALVAATAKPKAKAGGD
ncbi:hypothetical protein RMS29_001475 [Agrobacterium rosae]|uniref:Uncharacterized protein n=1 Tax=Agrobacterium rosae TaxID=1972867 RepID=A0ABU4VWC3_9HYPH|nr:hypothetical protein [Agrobacterium rosae]MDX8329591.1 hypothetical protein [Agrobacterium rosae]